MSNHTGEKVGNYRLMQVLGEGAFGSVYLGKHIYLQTQAAIKLLNGKIEAHNKEAFLQEAQMIAALKHTNILQVLEFGFEQGMPYLVIEYASNGTLRQKHPRATRVPEITVLSYVQQVVQGLQYAHDRGVIHRDIKPENLLFNGRGEVSLGDFGIALQGSQKVTESNIAGTAIYMAPEQAQGKARRASDQYSLGVVVYEWLTGTPPFRGRSFIELLGQHLVAPVPPMSGVTSAVERVVHKALEKDPEKRFAKVTAFADALGQAVKGGRTVPQPVKNRQGKTIFERLRKVIVEQLGVDESEVVPSASFVEDLNADSLDLVELVMSAEEEFKIMISDEDADQITTVQEAVDYLEEHLR